MKKVLFLMTVVLGCSLATGYVVSNNTRESNLDYNYNLLNTKTYKTLNLTKAQKIQLLKIEKEMRSQIQEFLFADEATIASQSAEISRSYKVHLCSILNKEQLKIYQSICKNGLREVASAR